LVVFEDAAMDESASVVALNYGILLSTPLKNCKKDEAVDGRSRSGHSANLLVGDAVGIDQLKIAARSEAYRLRKMGKSNRRER
jgi:hypothetical protein